MTGFGISPAGTAVAGVGLPSASSQLCSTGWQKSTTGAVSSVNIDSTARDITLDDYGSEEGMSDTAQRVYLCLQTLRGSRVSFQPFGFRAPPKITDDVLTLTREAVRLAMLPVTEDGSAELIDVTVGADGTRLYALVTWRDTRRNTTPTTRAQL